MKYLDIRTVYLSNWHSLTGTLTRHLWCEALYFGVVVRVTKGRILTPQPKSLADFRNLWSPEVKPQWILVLRAPTETRSWDLSPCNNQLLITFGFHKVFWWNSSTSWPCTYQTDTLSLELWLDLYGAKHSTSGWSSCWPKVGIWPPNLNLVAISENCECRG